MDRIRKAFGSQNPNNKLLVWRKQVAEEEEEVLRANEGRTDTLVRH